MKPQDLVDLLVRCYAEKLGLKRRHEAGAREVGEYDFNNTYQYVINREEAHVDWLRRAVLSLGGTIPEDVPVLPLPAGGNSAAHQADVLADDARLVGEFVERWRSVVEQVTDSRQKLMLRVMLGESLEQKRFFEQAIAGRHDLLGRRTSPSEASGHVLATRWIE